MYKWQMLANSLFTRKIAAILMHQSYALLFQPRHPLYKKYLELYAEDTLLTKKRFYISNKNYMKNKVLFVLSLLAGLFMINAGLDKFFHYMPMPDNLPPAMIEMMGAFSKINWLMPLVGMAELVGGLLLIFPKTRALGAIILFPVMIGILLTNIYTEPSGLAISGPFMLILLWIMYENRAKYKPMIS